MLIMIKYVNAPNEEGKGRLEVDKPINENGSGRIGFLYNEFDQLKDGSRF